MREQVSDQVGDGVRLSRSRRPLDEHATLMLQANGDPELLRIRRLAEQDLFRLVSRLVRLRLFVSLRAGGRRRRS